MMSQDNIKVFDVDECIKNFRKSYKVPKKKKETIINYIFNIYLVIKNNEDNRDNINVDNLDVNDINIDNLNVTDSKNNNKTEHNVLQNISIQLDSKGLSQLLSYINVIPQKYKLESKKNTTTTTNTTTSTLGITNDVDSSNVLQLENTEYPLLTYQKEDKKKSKTTKKSTKVKLTESKIKKTQCMGRTAKHTRCSRSCKNDSEYCQSHINNKCPYGRFDEELKEPEEKVVKKRGRKRKVEISYKFKNPDYETMWPEIVEGDKRLIDRYNNVYTYDLESPCFLGVKQLNGVIDSNKSILTSVF